MKFEKFVKSVGTHGLIVKTTSETWLTCGGVGMLIPQGVDNIGLHIEPSPVFEAIVSSVSDNDHLTLEEAILEKADGKPKDIVRVFETAFGDRVGISNANFGLLEKSDVLTYLEIEDENNMIVKIMVIRDFEGNPIGYITGLANF